VLGAIGASILVTLEVVYDVDPNQLQIERRRRVELAADAAYLSSN